MHRIMMVLEYDGSNYHGFQSQNNANTIQDEIQDSLLKLTGEKTTIISSGRTDTGVHALGQVIAFNTQSSIPPERFYLALNSFLPHDIRILSSQKVMDDFHPRYHAQKKQYSYYFYLQEKRRTFFRNYAWCTNEKLNLDEMQLACNYFIGKHNFLSFCSSGSSVKTYERTVEVCKLSEEFGFLKLDIIADGFLYNMVRIIVGTLVEIGRGKMKSTDIIKIIQAQNRSSAGPTAPPQGLYLVAVEYPKNIFQK